MNSLVPIHVKPALAYSAHAEHAFAATPDHFVGSPAAGSYGYGPTQIPHLEHYH